MTDAYRIDPDERSRRPPHRPRATDRRGDDRRDKRCGRQRRRLRGARRDPAVYYGCEYASAHSDRESTTVDQLVRIAVAFAIATAAYLSPDPLEAPPLAPA